MIGLERKQAEEAGLRVGELILLDEHIGEAVQGFQMTWIECQSGTVTCGGSVEIAVQLISVAEIVVVVGHPGILLDGCTNLLNRDVVLPPLLCNDAEKMQRVGMPRLLLKDFPITGFGFHQMAGAVKTDAELERFRNRALKGRLCGHSGSILRDPATESGSLRES